MWYSQSPSFQTAKSRHDPSLFPIVVDEIGQLFARVFLVREPGPNLSNELIWLAVDDRLVGVDCF